MMQELLKDAADSLRTFSYEKYGVKLKAAHAHELVAAYLGYPSKNALLAEKNLPISDFHKSAIVVMVPDEFISARRKKLQGLPSALPDSYTLGEAFYEPLFAGEKWPSALPPFRSFEKLARFLVENSDKFKAVFGLARVAPMHHYVSVNLDDRFLFMNVIHSHDASSGEGNGAGKTILRLPRVAGRIGFGEPEISVEKWTGGARRVIENAGAWS